MYISNFYTQMYTMSRERILRFLHIFIDYMQLDVGKYNDDLLIPEFIDKYIFCILETIIEV